MKARVIQGLSTRLTPNLRKNLNSLIQAKKCYKTQQKLGKTQLMVNFAYAACKTFRSQVRQY